MPETIEALIDSLFLEPYGMDDCLDIGRILNRNDIILEKDIRLSKAKEELKQTGVVNINASPEGVYVAHYRLHSETAINVLDFFIKNARERDKKKYLENKLTGFFKSYEWETRAWKYAESESSLDFLPYRARKKNSQVSDNTLGRRLLK